MLPNTSPCDAPGIDAVPTLSRSDGSGSCSRFGDAASSGSLTLDSIREWRDHVAGAGAGGRHSDPHSCSCSNVSTEVDSNATKVGYRRYVENRVLGYPPRRPVVNAPETGPEPTLRLAQPEQPAAFEASFNSAKGHSQAGVPKYAAITPYDAVALARFGVRGTAIITGGTGVLALQVARALLEHGLQKLILWDTIADDRQADVQDLIDDFPDRLVKAEVVDVTCERTVQWAVDEAVYTFNGAIDHLLCFAGVASTMALRQMNYADYRRIMAVNLDGAYLCAREVAGVMRSCKYPPGGTITLIASISAHKVSFPEAQLACNVSKAGVVHLARCLAAELSVYGIKTNSISPGYIHTSSNQGSALEDARAIWCSRNPLGRLGQPRELEGLVVLLHSGAGSYINGADMVVDGGGIVF